MSCNNTYMCTQTTLYFAFYMLSYLFSWLANLFSSQENDSTCRFMPHAKDAADYI